MVLGSIYCRKRSLRLKGHDYGAGGTYYVTICTHDRFPYFGHLHRGLVKLSSAGKIARQYWIEIPNHFPWAHLDHFVIMPEHIHGIIEIHPAPGTSSGGTLPNIMCCYKGAVSRYCRKNGYLNFAWQRSFYDRVLREGEIERIRRYIDNNPRKGRPRYMRGPPR